MATMEKNISLKDRMVTARKKNYNFDKLVQACEREIKLFVDNVIASNDRPSLFPRGPAFPRDVPFKVFLPAIPISPNETALLLEYLDNKYMDEDSTRIIYGDYFSIRRCWFKNAYKLKTHAKRYCY